tara:strand:+ start:652 stop:1659 length:1008 start_codon:yes stop_codon:yes gene_type:complete
MSNKIKASVVIPTCSNPTLKDCLDSLSSQEGVDREEYEVIVVENPKPTDSTRSLVASYEGFQFTHISTGTAEANAARNEGIKIAKGELICFTDDDCIPNPSWVSRHIAMHTLHSDVGCVGGPMHLFFQANIPHWLHREFRAILGECEITTPYESSLSFEVFPFEKKNHGWVSSGNMSVRKSVAMDAGLFPKSLSLAFSDGQIVASNDEVDFTNLCAKIGSPGMVHAPSAWVNHQVPQSKTTMRYMKRRFFSQGFADGVSLRKLYSELDTEELYAETLQNHESMSINAPYAEEVRDMSTNIEGFHAYITNLTVCKTCYLMGLQEGVHGKRVFGFDD